MWWCREELEAQRRKEEERQKYLAGETEQARRDLERLAMVRKRREEAAKKREEDAARGAFLLLVLLLPHKGLTDKVMQLMLMRLLGCFSCCFGFVEAKAREEALAATGAGQESDEESEKPLDSREIKNMNPTQLKAHLKARNLSIQGSKKDLMNRLLEYEASRK
jgi:hypothetical protein